LEALGGGATMANVNKTKFSSIEILKPSDSILMDFEKVTSKSIDQIKILQKYNFKLCQTRDLLLPRLMNGEIKI